MASGTFEHTFTYEIEVNEDESEVIGVGGSSDKALCEWVQKHALEASEIQVDTEIEWEADNGCVYGPPDNWEQPYYGDERTITAVFFGEGKDETLLPFDCKSTPKAVVDALYALVNDEDVDPPVDDEPRDY